jgi:hypothetical protein
VQRLALLALVAVRVVEAEASQASRKPASARTRWESGRGRTRVSELRSGLGAENSNAPRSFAGISLAVAGGIGLVGHGYAKMLA